MNPLSAGDVFLTVAIMSATFLAEVGFFHSARSVLKGTRSGQRVADARV